MVGNEHEQRSSATIDPDLLGRSDLASLLLLLPRVALGGTSLQFGWKAMQLPSLSPSDSRWLLAVGLTLSGIALVLGFLTGPAAFSSGTLIVAAWEQSSPMTVSAMSALAVLLVFAWRRAGQIGLDRWLLPSLGVAGYRGALVARGSSKREVI